MNHVTASCNMADQMEFPPDASAAVNINVESASIEKIEDLSWNDALGAAPGARVQQTIQGAQIRWEMDGQFPYFLRAQRVGELVGQLYLHRGFVHPDLIQWSHHLLKTPFLHRLWGVLSWFGGPVIFAQDCYEEVLRAFLNEVESLTERHGITAVKGATPAFYGGDIDWELVDSVFADYAYEMQERATIILDVNGDLDALWQGLTKEARQKVRKAERQEVQIFEDNTEDGLNRYYSVRLENARRNGLRPPSKESILASEPIYMRHGLAKLFLAEHEGQTVAGQLLVVFNGNVQLGGICYSDRARQLRLSANDLLQWELIKWANTMGHRRIDWAGFSLEPTSEKEAGINRFKEKWGGQVVRYHSYDKILSPRRFAALNWLKGQARKFGIR